MKVVEAIKSSINIPLLYIIFISTFPSIGMTST
ncbi:hypothetical protein OF001_U360026 [Pseudomonas sp. OF001]|nr:hypothetical protein OF001_U360026 [Pseudomonas sp. OF001]